MHKNNRYKHCNLYVLLHQNECYHDNDNLTEKHTDECKNMVWFSCLVILKQKISGIQSIYPRKLHQLTK